MALQQLNNAYAAPTQIRTFAIQSLTTGTVSTTRLFQAPSPTSAILLLLLQPETNISNALRALHAAKVGLTLPKVAIAARISQPNIPMLGAKENQLEAS